MNILIVDDEQHARKALQAMIRDFYPHGEIIGQADSVSSGVQAIHQWKPDVVLLDIKLHQGTGFDILDQLVSPPHVIFTTAYDAYAVKAFKVNAIDYLLKPINPKELIAALEKVREKHPATPSPLRNKIMVSTPQELILVNYEDIIRCEADVNYTHIFLAQGKKLTTPITLKEFSSKLPEDQFIRIHKSHLANVNYIEKYIKKEGGFIQLNNGEILPISRRRKGEFLKRFG